jgi:small subunit ribosomal protein S9
MPPAQPNYPGGVGKRKTAIARVRLVPGPGEVLINGRSLDQVYSRLEHKSMVMLPFRVTNMTGRFNAIVNVTGGGSSGQAGAIRHGIARALVDSDESLRGALRANGLLTRDARIKERKKYGLKRARKAPQYTKR